ncbi:MAG: SDR family oxidoreductase [Planctomycetota bacterium]
MTKSERPPVLITGAASGVGRACALRFAKEGFDVVVSFPEFDRLAATETAALVSDCSTRALLAPCDVSSTDQIEKMFDLVASEFGWLDSVVNCAGVTHFIAHSDLDQMTEEKWDQILAVNTKGPFFVSRAAVPLLRKGKSGSIVNVSSVAGVSGAGSCIAYCASKGALNTMTKSLARALAPEILVNSVCPGPIDSDWLRQGIGEEEMAERVASFPIPRLAKPEDIADTVYYLSAGTSLSTGQVLIVDGGRTM